MSCMSNTAHNFSPDGDAAESADSPTGLNRIVNILVESRRVELLTSSVQTRRSTS